MVPIMMLAVTTGYIFFWLFGLGYIYSNGEVVLDSSKPFVGISIDKKLKNYVYSHALGFLWNIAFLLTVSNFVITGACAIWYYKSGDKKGSLIGTTVWWMFRYHIGTLAFGSLILAIVWLIRSLADYLDVRNNF